ncbi:hypothetical protein Q5P01_021101 [Channa striata]|uniref:Uncharacterized protein n=1 Tax=Channa striata TaxID=64152 RepID=A0AA88RY71_CHASR|nr:hypothetical protein Q5P01_021101 [Channa striata]
MEVEALRFPVAVFSLSFSLLLLHCLLPPPPSHRPHARLSPPPPPLYGAPMSPALGRDDGTREGILASFLQATAGVASLLRRTLSTPDICRKSHVKVARPSGVF